MKRTLLILCALLAMAYSAGTQAQNVWDGTVAGSFAGGNGTAEEPYQIADGAQLAKLAQDVNGGNNYAGTYFVLTADIELNDTTNWKNWETTAPANTWTPIGSSTYRFSGTLDGDGHSVSGIYINSTADDQGLVGYLGSGGTLQNLGVKASYIKGVNHVGGLCGYNNRGTVKNCYNTGSVAGTGYEAGGVCGLNEYGTVTNCYNSGSITGNGNIGGLCGRNMMGTVTNCYNTGNLTGNGAVGGLCGTNDGTVTNCYNTSSVTGTGGLVGGVCGENWQGTVTNCYNTGSVTGNSEVGGVCGKNSDGTMTNCYYLTGTATGGINGNDAAGQAEAKTETEFASGEVAWLLGEGWGQTIGTDEYPVLGGEKVYQYSDGTYGNTPLQAGEDGFYLISNADELRLFASMVNGGQTSIKGKLTADILLNDISDWENWDESTAPANSWTPIGSDANPFTGTLDGDGHSVSGIYINSEAYYQGLVGVLGSGGILQNLGVKASYIKGSNRVGGLCGSNWSGTVSNCYNSGSVTGTNEVGGVCGDNSGTVTNCYNTGSVAGTEVYVGGVCGANGTESTVTNCYNSGSVTGSGSVGGVCGQNRNTLTNCYNTGKVAGTNWVGGVCGMNWRTVTNCYYLEGCGAAGDGTSKNADEFASGEVAWLLQGEQAEQVWGQNISFEPKDDYPVLGGLKVVQNGDGYKNELSQDGDFYLISTADELRLFAAMVNGTDGMTQNRAAKGRLTADIVLNDTTNWKNWNESTTGLNTWTPIGSDANPFTGTLDGDGHSVSGIYINSTANYQGLVGYNGGTLQNLGVKASYIKGGRYVGGLCGDNSDTVTNCCNTGNVTGTNYVGGLCGRNYTTVTNCYNTGSVTGTGSYVGGLCGTNYGTVTNCYNTGSVTGTNTVGGLCGHNRGTVTNCYNNGSVTGTGNHVGGLCGWNQGTVTNCYNTGSVTGSGYVGGLCGVNEMGDVGNCYNTGKVAGTNWVGGLCGMNMMGTVTNCYYLTGKATGGINGSDAEGKAEAKTAEQFQSGEVAWLLSTGENGEIWGQNISFEPKDSYPVLGGEKVYQYSDGTYGNTPLQAGEDGFYLISNADELRRFADMVNSGQTSIKGRLTANILLNDTEGWENWNESTEGLNSWTPIGSSSQPFTGTLDGDGHSVSGIYINNTANYQGLVGYLGSGGTLQNLGVKASYIKGGHYVGGVCGENEYGTVTNCYNTGSVTGTGDYIGGLCGRNWGTVTNCYNTGSVTGSYYVGGLCGRNQGTVNNCYNTGNVTGNSYVGGLCGQNWRTVTNCYNSGSVTGRDMVGGVCGENNYGTLTNCYYLDTCGAAGDGTSKNAKQFKSGEVAWLLNGSTSEGESLAWYQNLDNGQTVDDYPVLTADEAMRVYQLTLTDGGNATAFYANSDNFTLPAPAGREGYTFAGWFTTQTDGTQVQDNATLTADLTLYAQWTANTYTVTFEANGGEGNTFQQTFTYGVAQTLTPNAFTRTGYSFTGWNTKIDGSGSTYLDGAEVQNLTTEANGSITLYAQWSINSYTIRFVNADGTELQSSEVEYGQRPAYNGETPTKESTAEFDYTFAGWDPEIAIVTGDATYTATYTETRRSYTVTFVDEDGTTVLQSSEVEYGQTPVYSSNTPTKASTAEFDYTFAGWTPKIADVTGEATYKATYTETKRSYTITFVDEDGTTVLQSSKVEYGQTPVYSSNTPTKESTAEFHYTFAGWTPKIASVTEEATYKATYTATKRSYTITFVDEDGTELQSSEVEYGQTPAYNGETPTKESTAEFDYTFAGWTPDIAIVTDNATYTATYTATKRSYTLAVGLAEGCEGMGEVSGSGSYEYGTVVTLTATAHEGYKFMQWSDGDTNATRTIIVEGEVTLTATFEAEGGSETGLEEQMADTFQVIGMERSMRIEGSEQEACVFNTAGQLIYRGTKRIIEVHAAGIYLVRIGNETKRVMVR